MEENKEFSLLDFFEPQANLDVMKFKGEGCNAVLVIEDLNELNLMHVLITGIGRYYYAVRSNSKKIKVEQFKESVKALIDAEFNAVDANHFNDRK